ncbi:MAG: ferrous iron transport protein B, partial [Clostridia bacterium]|nr:ferrous iron transport protein B [Clostridia bacterium]
MKNVMLMSKIIALAGNPNVGKSTIFNALTGMNQHTGNWPGKTVEKAEGKYHFNGCEYTLVDLPGTYSLFAHSLEEEIARDFICFNKIDCVVVVCDATCLERNLNLVLQTIEITKRVVVCVNLLDEAKKKQITIDLDALSTLLQVYVVGTSARNQQGLHALQKRIECCCETQRTGINVMYPKEIETCLQKITTHLPCEEHIRSRFLAIQLLENHHDAHFTHYLHHLLKQEGLQEVVQKQQSNLLTSGYSEQIYKDALVNSVVQQASRIASLCTMVGDHHIDERDRKIDRILTSKQFGIPIMLVLLCCIFWLTIFGANIPSAFLADLLFAIEAQLDQWLTQLNVAPFFIAFFVHGMYRVLAWVVSVMLPPMAIFFPLFTLLEDVGYLPRVAFNLDHYFKRACTCGKQALSMCMGFGCNAAGVIGTRIIDSPRERMIALLTNNFVPCNGRFPTIILLCTLFFIHQKQTLLSSILSALMLGGVVALGVLLTFLSSYILSKTLLKGEVSSFTLELSPYRRPQIIKVIIRSIFDRTLKVLYRAIIIAAPAGCLIWILANTTIHDISILQYCAAFLDPFGKAIGMDGVIILAFILGFPANEIVFPIMIMIYMATGSLIELDNQALYTLLLAHDWSMSTALCTTLFTLLHWPCSTTCLTIYKETNSLKWTL